MKKYILYTLPALLILALSLAGCGAEQPPAAAETPAAATAISVSDMAGETVTLPAPAAKVVTLNPGDAEIVYALGRGDALAGRGEFCDYPAEVLDLPQVQSGNDLNVEALVALAPDLVLVSPVYQTQAQIDALKNAGLTLAVSQASTISQVYTCISMIGGLLGRETEAQALVQEMTDAFASVAPPPGAAGGSVYFEVSPLEWGLWTAGSGTFMDEICAMLGLENSFSDVNGWAQISQEQVLDRDPDYIVTVTMYYGEGPRPDDEIMARPGWDKLKAVREKRIFCADSDSITRPGPRLKDAAQELYAFVYGD